MRVRYLTEEEVLGVYRRHIGPTTLRNPGGFHSAAARPIQSAFEEDAYPTLFLKAAAIVQSLAENQCFVDGNKRIAWLAGTVFLRVNGIEIIAPPEESNDLFRQRIAKGMTVEELASWLERHSKVID